MIVYKHRNTYEIRIKMYIIDTVHLVSSEKGSNLNYIQRSSSYRAVNTYRLGCKNQSVKDVWGNNCCLFGSTQNTNTLCGQNVEVLNVDPGGTYTYNNPGF
jgi:lipoate-protein ligase B